MRGKALASGRATATATATAIASRPPPLFTAGTMREVDRSNPILSSPSAWPFLRVPLPMLVLVLVLGG